MPVVAITGGASDKHSPPGPDRVILDALLRPIRWEADQRIGSRMRDGEDDEEEGEEGRGNREGRGHGSDEAADSVVKRVCLREREERRV